MFSIAMTTYNGERFLDGQLRSLSEQTLAPAELVVCDDVSTDQTEDIVKHWAKRLPFPLRFLQNEQRLGWRRNFLKAASLCASDYIAFCDQDDVWRKDKLATVASYLRANPCTLLQHGFRLIDENGDTISGNLDWAPAEHEAPWSHGFGQTLVFHRSLMEFTDLWESSIDHNQDSGQMAHDQWIYFLSSVLGRTITIREALSYYRQHGSNAVGFIVPKSFPLVRETLFLNCSRLLGGGAVRDKREAIVWKLRRRLDAAHARRAIVEKILARLEKDRAEQLAPKLQYYRDYPEYLAARLAAYRSGSHAERLGAMLSTVRLGQYGRHGKRGAKDAVLDILYGVMS